MSEVSHADERDRARFLQEARAASAISHANVCVIYDLKEHEGEQFIVMEYVDAPSLRKLLHGPLGEADTVRIMGQVCSALAFAHQNNVVHRDIKPENILVSANGVVKVLDFGLAKWTGDRGASDALTADGLAQVVQTSEKFSLSFRR